MLKKIPIGISACLMGQEVRYNGGHKQSRLCLDHLVQVFEFVPYCPEVAIGMGVPREPIRLVGPPDNPRAIGTVTKELDVTQKLDQYGVEVGRASIDLCGYILMRDSPSCGLFSTKVYSEKGNYPGKHAGIFVRALRRTNPLLPLEEEGRLNDAVLRENFIARVFAYADWKETVAAEPSAEKVIKFHSRYKYVLMAHSQKAYRELGRMVAEAGLIQADKLAHDYLEKFMVTIAKPATRKGHANTLYHLVGYLKDNVPGHIRQELTKSIEDYRNGIVNLAVPVTLISHYLKLHGSEYIQSQAYLNPYSRDLGLRNAI